MKSIIYLALIVMLSYIMYNLWQVEDPVAFLYNGGILIICIIVYYLIPRDERKYV